MLQFYQKPRSAESKNMYFYCCFTALCSIQTNLPLPKRLEIWFIPNWHKSVCSSKISRQCCMFIRSHVQISPKIWVFIAFFTALRSIYTNLPLTKRFKILYAYNLPLEVFSIQISSQCCKFIGSYAQKREQWWWQYQFFA